MNKKINYLLLAFCVLSCSSIKVKNLNNENIENRKIDDVSIFAANEKIVHNGIKISDFVVKENKVSKESYDVDWESIKREMKDLAISNGANLIEINTIGYGIKGHIFYIEGSFFYSENQAIVNKQVDEECNIVVFRDGLESVLGSAFKINIKMNNEELGALTKKKPIGKKLDNCNQDINLLVNKSQFNLKVEGTSKYYKVSKRTSGGSSNGGVQIGIGGISLVEIEHKDLGKLMFYQK
ncbi:hypothetical protein GTQ40_11765 [Flavobacteriaceae bacterium R38]|nr:hypothetical protein [Flavobacteriaceae bacterium R38]